MFLKIKKLMDIKGFISKYKIIIFLVAMIVVLAFVKSYFGKKISENTNSTNSSIGSEINTNITSVSITPSPSKTQNNFGETKPSEIYNSNQNNLQNNELIVSNKETDDKRSQLTEKGRTYQTEKEYQAWFETLSFEDQEILLGDKPIQVSQLKDELPYEGSTFIVEDVFSNSLLMAKSKIDDLEKAETDLRDWLSTKAMNFEDLSISWIE